jgi:hypothetical protein
MDADQLLRRIRREINIYGDLLDNPTDSVERFYRTVRELDEHLSAGGTPPEEWREGLNASGQGARYCTIPADPDAYHPMPYGDSTWGVVDEETGDVVAWTMSRETADDFVNALNAGVR